VQESPKVRIGENRVKFFLTFMHSNYKVTINWLLFKSAEWITYLTEWIFHEVSSFSHWWMFDLSGSQTQASLADESLLYHFAIVTPLSVNSVRKVFYPSQTKQGGSLEILYRNGEWLHVSICHLILLPHQ